jgi:uncharacterized repeat protein (TIGR03803 family)
MMTSRVLITVLLVSTTACARLGGSAALPSSSPTTAVRDSVRFKTVWEFNESDGCDPESAPIAVGQKLYGTTSCGGRFGNGTIYTMDGHDRVRDFHDFERDGQEPLSQLVLVGQTLYGTTYSGGKDQRGTVYSIDAATGKVRWYYSFKGSPDGANPNGGLLDLNGTLYGMTASGGTGCSASGNGCGTVFTISTSGTERVIYSFQGAGDGAGPIGTLTDVGGTLYGTTAGDETGQTGTVFSVTPYGVEQPLHAFTGTTNDGLYPTGNLIFADNKLFGTTESGGATNKGTAYSITTSGQFKIVHSFGGIHGGDGWLPGAGFTIFNGKFFGTTDRGGDYSCGGFDGCGVIYVLKANGDEKVIHSFGGGRGGSEPVAPLLVRGRALYGTTVEGGRGDPKNYGIMFTITP